MSACEKCWNEAFGISQREGRPQTEVYREVLVRNEGVHERLATPDEVDEGCELGITYDRCPGTVMP